MKASTALRRMIAARSDLLLTEPFWGVPALRLLVQEDPTCKTAWVDGQTLGFNPTFVEALSMAELKALWLHEIEHVALGHPWRREGREHQRWNEAADRAINPVLRDAGYTLPEGALFELAPEHNGKSAEWIYARLPEPQEGDEGGGQQGGDEPGRGTDQGNAPSQGDQPSDQPGDDTPDLGGDQGEVRDAPTQAAEGQDAPPTEEDWRQIMQQAAQLAKARGQLPAGMDRVVEQANRSKIDWRSALRRFAQEVARADYSWHRPNSRYMPQGLYLPCLRNHEVGGVVIAVDTSGSIDQTLLAQFGEEIRAVVDEVQPVRVHVMYADARVNREEVFERGDSVELHACGGGGTDFRPVFEAVEKLEEAPVCVIYLTDLDGRFPDQDPGVPTMWVTARDKAEVPFGDVLVAET